MLPVGKPMRSHFLILGAGAVVMEYYAPALARLGALGSTTVVDMSAENTRLLRQNFPGIHCECRPYGGLVDFHSISERDTAAIVALPNAQHVKASLWALERGFHVLCEKPVALSAADCCRLASAAVERERLVKVAMSRRYLPSLMTARELVRTGELGRPRKVRIIDRGPFQWRPTSFSFFEPAAGGVLADMGSHYLDFLLSLFQAMEPVRYEDDWRGGVESACRYELQAGDVAICMDLSRLAGSTAEVAIDCEKATIRIKKSDESEVLVEPHRHGKPRRIALKAPFSRRDWPLDFHGSFCEMLMDLDRAIGGQSSEIADIRDAEATTRLIEWAYQRRTLRPRCQSANGVKTEADCLITGATGFIGGHLLERLHSSRQGAIRVAARSPGSCANVARYPVEIVAPNLLCKEEVEAAVAGARVVFHLAYGRDGRNASDVTIRGTENVVNAAIARGVEAVVVLSTMYVFGFPANLETVDEDCPYRPYGGEYGLSKARMERWCLKRAETSGKTRIIVLNPTCVFGPGGAAYTSLPVELARQGQFCWINGGTGLCNYTFVENLVDAIILAAENPSCAGKRFIVNDGVISWREFLEPFLAPLQRKIPAYTKAELDAIQEHDPAFSAVDAVRAIVKSPEVRRVLKRSRLVKALHGIAESSGLDVRFNRTTALAPSANASLTGGGEGCPPSWLSNVYNCSRVRFAAKRAETVLGWRPRIPLEAAREKTLAWLRDADVYRDSDH